MNYSETWKLAFDALRANKMKALLTMLGVIIGSGAIVLVVTIGLTGRGYILSQIEGVGSNLVYAYLVSPGIGNPRPLGDEISLADVQAVQMLPEVVVAAGTHDVTATVVIDGAEYPVSLVGVTEGFQRIRNLVILSGRYFDDIDIQSHAHACLITQHLANRHPNEDLIGKDMHLGELQCTIIGVFRERVETFGQSEIVPDSVIVPFPLMKYFTSQEFVKVLYAQAATADEVPGVTRMVRELLQNRHRSQAKYEAENLTSILDTARKISTALSIVLLAIALIALVISGIGIMNIMLVTVTQRTREIGIRMAIGARRSEILWQFLLEAFLIAGTGALIGVGLAVTGATLVELLLPEGMRLPISWLSVVISLTVSSLIGILFGYLPASRAAKLEPTEALHYE